MNQLFCLQHRGDRYDLGMTAAMTQVPVTYDPGACPHD